MFGWFVKNKKRALEKKYQQLYEQAIHEQRNGNIRGYSELIAEAEEIAKLIESPEASAPQSSR